MLFFLCRIAIVALTLAVFLTVSVESSDKPKVVHVYVALCDNDNQGIIPVPSFLGNGQDPASNLYWGAMYGIKTFFKHHENWELVLTLEKPLPNILERCVFKYGQGDAYLVADAYDGAKIRETVVDFLRAASGNEVDSVAIPNFVIRAGGASDLIAYIGHNGLMDFNLKEYPKAVDSVFRDVIILACASKDFFEPAIAVAGAYPLLWTTGLMAPEAYTLVAAVEAWIHGRSPDEIALRAAEAYSNYQKCSLSAAKRLLVTGK